MGFLSAPSWRDIALGQRLDDLAQGEQPRLAASFGHPRSRGFKARLMSPRRSSRLTSTEAAGCRRSTPVPMSLSESG